jgi:dolichyl-phosphate beta-glucosyltransferase
MLDLVDLSLILPAFNERASIGNTVDEAFAYFRSRGIHVQIIVAADGTDGTRKLVGGMTSRYPDLDIIGHDSRAGKGRGVKEAVALARGRVIGYADADNKVPIADFDRIQPWLASFPIVIGSRALELSQIEHRQPWYRRLGSKGFSHVMQMIVGVPGIGDTHCGFKFFQRDAPPVRFRRGFHFLAACRINPKSSFSYRRCSLSHQAKWGVRTIANSASCTCVWPLSSSCTSGKTLAATY